jgi:oxygen-independent coproporphyrinogen-3 oxidase
MGGGAAMTPPAAELRSSTSAGAGPAGGGAGARDRLPGLYLHVPFCSAVCPYCDFAVTVGGPRRRSLYLDALLAEIDRVAGEAAAGGPFDTVYFGGGTPSALAVVDLERIVAALTDRLGVRLGPTDAAGAWLHFEANPEDVTAASLAAWRALGVRTLSLGVQSFDPAALAFLGRRHGPGEARRSVERAREAGFPTVSVDLIYGLPGQDAAAWRRDLETAVALAPDHLSCYQLTVHPGTPFAVRRGRGELVELGEDGQAELFALTHALLADAGYPAYEVSNFARAPAHRSRHNVKYWDHTPYLGLGPSAHSFGGIAASPPHGRRWWNERRLAAYRARLARGERPIEGEESLGAAELALERLMLALRTPAGLDLDRFRERYGVDLEAPNRELIARLTDEGLLLAAGRRLRPTRRGLAVADSLAGEFQLEGFGGSPTSGRKKARSAASVASSR